MAEMNLTRKWFSDESTIGELTIDGYRCYTLEDRIRKPGVKVQDQTCIPAGTYPVTLQWSAKRNRLVPWLENVPNFTDIEIHPGNWASNTSGCILVGVARGIDEIYQSRIAFDALFPKVEEATKDPDGLTITIEEAPDDDTELANYQRLTA